MGKGKRYELELKNSINEHTDSSVKAHRPDYSGSSEGEVADLMVVWQDDRYEPMRCGHAERHVAYVEVKKRTADEGKRCTVMDGSSDGQSGLGELKELLNESPPWAKTDVAVKFNNRELIVLDARELYFWLDAGGADEHEYDYHGARLTPSDNISMVKPELDYWRSSQAGKQDHVKLLNEIGVEDYYITQ